MIYALALSAFLPTALQQEDPYKGLFPGDRVMITFRSGGTISGTLVLLPPGGRPIAAKPGGPAPFSLFYFRSDAAECKKQDDVLDEWRKKHPEARVEVVAQGTRTELWQAHSIATAPSLVLKDPATLGQVRLSGAQTAEQLDEALDQVRGGEGGSIDFTKETHITVDLGLEYPGLNGTMTLPKRDIKEIRRLQKLDEVTRRRLEEEKARIRKDLEAQNDARRKAEKERDEKALEALQAAEKEEKEKGALSNDLKTAVERAEKIQKGREYLKKFPPPEWGPEKLKQIANKGITRLPVTADERLFSEIYEVWLEARKYEEEQAQKKKEEQQQKKDEVKPPEK